jgi:hypothetical protein
MEGYQMRIIAKTFIVWFNPYTHEFKTTDRPRRKHGKDIRLCK